MSKAMRVVAWLAVGLCGAAAVAEDDLAAVEKKIQTAWEHQKSMSAKLTMSTHMEMGTMVIDGSGEGTVEFLRADGKVRVRTEMRMTSTQKMGDQDHKAEQTMLNIVDGDVMYTLTETMGQKSATKAKTDPKMSGDPAAVFEELHKSHQMKLLPEETVDGAKVYVISATPNEKGPAGGGRMVFYFHQEAGVVVKMQVFGEGEKPMTTVSYGDVKRDPKIDAERFKFTAPEGVQVIDQTAAPTLPPPGSAPASAPHK